MFFRLKNGYEEYNVNDIPSAKQDPQFSFLKAITTRSFTDKKSLTPLG